MEVENRPTVKGIIVGCSVPTLVFSGLMLFIAMPNIIAWLGPNPPAPEITYGEFPFRIEYELNGELIVIDDTLICEFVGFELIGPKKIRSWKSRFVSGNGEGGYLLLQIVENTNIYCCVGNPEYYMGDKDSYLYDVLPYDVLPYFARKKPGSGYYSSISTTELLDKYGIKLIGWEFSEPIENSFH